MNSNPNFAVWNRRNLIEEPQDCLKWNGKVMVWLVCAARLILAGVTRTNAAPKESASNITSWTKEKFLEVLTTKQSAGGVNIGFQVKDNAVYTY